MDKKRKTGLFQTIVSFWIAALMIPALTGCATNQSYDQRLVGSSEVIVTHNLNEVANKALQLAETYGSESVLVIFDIDNTLLTMPQDLGGDGWFSWQEHLLEAKRNSQYRTVNNFGDLIFLQGVFFSVGKTKTTEPDAAKIVRELKNKNIPTLAVTARGHEFRGATLRELKRAGINFDNAPECGAPLCVKRGIIQSPDVKQALKSAKPKRSDIKADMKYRGITVADGLVMLAGQDKGIFLDLLLESFANRSFDHIVITDDSERNIKNYEKSAYDTGANLVLYHYTLIEDTTPPLETSEQRQGKAASDTRAIRKAVCQAMTSDWCEIK